MLPTAIRRWYWLLLIPCLAVLAIPLYNHDEPRLLGVPFFYAWQFIWVMLSAVFTAIVYLKVRGHDHGDDAP